MKPHSRYAAAVLNLTVAVAISLVVNFSHLLLVFVDRGETSPRYGRERMFERPETALLAVHPDGHGYLVYAAGDSVYVPQSRVRRLSLREGDRIVADLAQPRRAGAHAVMERVRVRNGAEFDYNSLYNRPSEGAELALQLLYYLLVSFVLLSILTGLRRDGGSAGFARRCCAALLAAVALYFVAPVTQWPTGRIVPNFMNGRLLDYMLLLKCSFAVAVSILYGRIYVLISQRQAVELENEQLKNDNLTTRYNMLVGQINPHFFFNSLNSLAMLVREGDRDKALTYIDQLSYTFRYILRSGQSTLVTLDEELKFAEAYGYLFRIRYEDKIFFDVDVAPECRGMLLPALTLQPLIGNAVKHNAITTAHPLRIAIRTEGQWLMVSNPCMPKLEPEPSTGIGLENLRNRWRLLTGCDIEIGNDGRVFTVRLPLQKDSAI